MRIRTLLLLILALPGISAAQDPEVRIPPNAVIEVVELSGIGEQRLSDDLRESMRQLSGQPYDEDAANAIADRIQTELSEYVAAPRAMPGTQPDRVRLVFVVARISDDDALESNINSRYEVEAVDLDGISRDAISADIYDDMQRMVGQRLNAREADRVRDRLTDELEPKYSVYRRVRRGGRSRQVQIVYEVRKVPLLPYRARAPYVVYHSKQGFSAVADLTFEKGNAHAFRVGVANSADELIERYAGFRVGFESIRLGTEHLGISLDYSGYRAQWEPQTVAALEAEPAVPGRYRLRRTFEPALAFAVNQDVYLTAGISLAELEMESPGLPSESARAGIGSIRFDRTWETNYGSHDVDAGYSIRAGAGKLQSDFIYTRHSWGADYRFDHDDDDHVVMVKAQAGRLEGRAPLFERFSLGNTQTLRGWNKFDIAPLGGSRMGYGSVEYRFHVLQVFYDVGTVWNAEEAAKARHSIGFGLGDSDRDGWFVNVGFPIRDANVKPMFSAGIRF